MILYFYLCINPTNTKINYNLVLNHYLTKL